VARRRRRAIVHRFLEMRDVTDAYIDRHGTAQVDAAVLAAFAQR
jgi:hypothetical protein